MPPIRKPAKPTLSLTEMVAPPVDVITARKTMFANWLDEADMVQQAFVEGLLSQLPSFADHP